MLLPPAVSATLQGLAEHTDMPTLKAAAARLSLRYRGQRGDLKLRDEAEVLAYALTRLPATYAAGAMALGWTKAMCEGFEPQTQLDVGCGSGAALMAARALWPTLAQTGEDQHEGMLALGRTLLPTARFSRRALDAEGEAADLVTACYALGEGGDPARLAAMLWRRAKGLIVIIEPGTPRGFATILALRTAFLALGGRVVAPCPHQQACPMAEEGWCHFAARVERSRLHRLLKDGDVPYEDEPFCYLAVAKGVPAQVPQARILDRPQRNKVGVQFSACLAAGTLGTVAVSKRDKERHALARRLGRGDALMGEP